ncbi:acetoin utilization protein AcuC [Acidothermaceae bacterium B102]|nr:acetoin utilization protein AcuC [Acidothermaceae bacterium B102]
MSESVLVVWDESLLAYDFGPSHPMQPVRLELTMALCHHLGLLDTPGVSLHVPQVADDATLELVHTRDYVAAVRRAPEDLLGRLGLRYGIGTSDTPTFPRMHEASARIVGGSVAAARAVWSGQVQHAVNVAGGLHHAMPGSGSGFCVYNDAAIAIATLLDAGAERVAYVDVDVHHGDGVQTAFYDDPRVLTISLHESGATLFPGTGDPHETGGGEATGQAVNVALPAGTGDAGWLRAFHAVVPGLLRQFRPQMLVTQHGCDSHHTDPLAHLELSVNGQRASYEALHELAHELTGGRWLSLGGGGYQVVDVVPRSWTHLVATAVGRPLEPSQPTPDDWRRLVTDRTRREAPQVMGEGGAVAYRAWHPGDGDAVDAAVLATRRAVFPLHGLDPMDPRD